MVNHCAQCGVELAAQSTMCANCGATRSTAAGSPAPGGQSTAKGVGGMSNPYRNHAIATASVAILVVATLMYLDMRPGRKAAWIGYAAILWWQVLAPIMVGALVVAISGATAPPWLTNARAWLDRRGAVSIGSTGKLDRFFARPVLWVYERLRQRADAVPELVLRTGAQAAAVAFAVCFAFLIVCGFIALVYVAVVIALIGAVLWFVAAVMAPEALRTSGSGGREPSSASGSARESVTYRGTNAFNEEVVGRTDADGNIISGTNFLNEERTGRIDDDGNLYEGTNWLNEEKIGRIDADGNVFSGTNAFNETKVGRIDSDGNILEGSNWFTERKIGRVERRS